MNLSKGASLATGVNVEHVSPQELYDVMTAASSQDPAQIQESSKRLKQMLDMFGTFHALHEIAATKTVPLIIRQQSIIQFKNAALGHWRSRKVLSDEQRIRIRNRCLTFLDEEDDTIAQCNEIIVSKISRQDFPTNWGSLVNDIISTIDMKLQARYTSMDEDPRNVLMLRRGLKLLNGILKEFASIKMLNGVKTMAKIVEDLHLVLYNYYSQLSTNLYPSAVTAQSIGYEDILLAHLVYKCMVKMAIWLWSRIDKVPKDETERNQAWLSGLFQNSAIQLKTLTELRNVIIMSLTHNGLALDSNTRRSVDLLTRHIRHFGKFFRRLQQLAPIRFVELPMCGEMILFYWSQVDEATRGPLELIGDNNEAVYPLRFLVQGMVLFKESLSRWTLHSRKRGISNKNTLSEEFVKNAVQLLITRFMPLNPTDLEQWMADPEEWVNNEDKENDLWEYEMRPCSERVLMQLCSQYDQVVIPLLEDIFKQVAAKRSVDLQSVVQKEALYCAIGRCATRLKDVIPFTQWLEQTLTVEAHDTNPNYPIIKRRIAWLIGKWVSEDCASLNDPRIWEVLVHLLKDRGPGTDSVVRLTAAMALKECLDSVDLNPEYFVPFLPTAVSELIRLLGEVDTFDSKCRVDQSLNVVIEQSRERIVPFMAMIIEPLPQLWTEAGDQWLFKSSLLVTVTKLVESVRSESTYLGAIVVPLVRESLSPGVIINLDEDGLNLWLAALRNTLTLASVNGAPALLDLFPQALLLLSTNLDLLGKTTSIIESYFLLDAPALLQAAALDVFSALRTAFKSQAVMVNLKDILITLNLLIQLTPSNLWGEPMHTSGLFAHILITLIDGEVSTLLLTEHICLLARIVMADAQMFLQLMSATASSQNVTEAFLYEGLLDQWWSKFDNMSEPRHRKLTAMGIASLVSTGRPEVLQRLPIEIFNLWIDVFCEIKEARISAENDRADSPAPSPSSLRRYWELDEAPLYYYQGTEGTPEYDRRKALYDRDPVRTMQLGAHVAIHLQQAELTCGAEVFRVNYLEKAEPALLKQIQSELACV